MNISQALERAQAMAIPGLFGDEAALEADRIENEEAISVLAATWMAAPAGSEGFSFDLVRSLADRNRELCDDIGISKLRDRSGSNLSRHLSDTDLIRGTAALQHRDMASVEKSAGAGLRNLDAAYAEAPVSGTVVGIDIETTDMYPDRGYIVNVGLQVIKLSTSSKCDKGYTTYCGIPPMYENGVPLSDIHHITWQDLAGKKPFRRNTQLQEAILAALTSYPYMAHNASFEDSWFMLHLDGYAEARKAGRVIPIDTRDLCRRLDPDVRTLPRESRPATLENWAHRRGTLGANENERHLALDDVSLMMRTVIAEFKERNMF